MEKKLQSNKENLLESLYEIYDDIFEIPNIIKKIEDNKELTQEETEKILQYIKKKSLENKKKSKDIFPIKGRIYFKLFSLKGRMGGKKTSAIVRSTEKVTNLPKDIATNSNEVLKGVKITSENVCPENISTLLRQYKTTENYLRDALTVIEELSERIVGPERDYETPIAEEAQNKMEEGKQRIKSLGQQYQRNKGKK